MTQSEDAYSLSFYAKRLFKLAGGYMVGRTDGLYFKAIDDARREAEAKGLRFASFANYDYLGLSQHPDVEAAAVDAIKTFGSGALASRLVGGERSIHSALERSLADYVGTEEAMVLVSGFLTNDTLISTLFGSRDLIIVDELSHASIMAGLKGTRATSVTFRHNDLDHLDALLKEKRQDHVNCLIVTEGLYSMDGDIPDLSRILTLKENHRAWLLIDESHSHGVIGETGRGICEHAGEDPARVDLIVGTLSKSFVSCGGFIAAAKPIIDVLRFGLPGFVYSVGIPPVVAAMAHKAVELAGRESWRVARLAEKTARLQSRAAAAGLDTGAAFGRGIVPILYQTQDDTLAASAELMAAGIYAPPIVQVGVPKDQPRIRFFLSAAHDDADIDRAVDVLAGLDKGGQERVSTG